MISVNEALAIHQVLIEKFGGAYGVRDIHALESALARPFQTFDSNFLYETIEERAAALFQSLISNHPFIDGNKRISYVLMRLFLKMNQRDIHASEQEKYDFVIKVASGESNWEEILDWIRHHSNS